VDVKAKRIQWLAVAAFIVVFAITRVPDLMPANFSAAVALAFCAGVFFPGRMAWWLPLATFLGTDLLLNLYYLYYKGVEDAFKPDKLLYLLPNYLVYPLLILAGRKFTAKASFLSLLGGGIFGAILFYLITNTTSWLFDPNYVKTLGGWLQSLTMGTPGYPPTWSFFINSLTSGGLFTGLFAGAMKLMQAASEKEAEEKETEEEEEEEPSTDPEPEETKA
jgi:hypothetical protein